MTAVTMTDFLLLLLKLYFFFERPLSDKVKKTNFSLTPIAFNLIYFHEKVLENVVRIQGDCVL